MAFEGKCKNPDCEQLLFQVPDFEAFSEKRPVTLTCRGCGTPYLIVHKGSDILYRVKGEPSSEAIAAEKYG